MKNLVSLSFCLAIIFGCQQKQSPKNELIATFKNSSEITRTEVVSVALTADQSNKLSEAWAGTIGKADGVEAELVDENGDGKADVLKALVTLEAGQEIKVDFAKFEATSLKKRTQAEISIKTGGEWEGKEYKGGSFENVDELKPPKQQTDHSYWIRYEGPGFENELIGYRYYLDWRNALDIFGKKTDAMVLQNVGLDGYDSYHEPSDWGMDILKAGKSLGIGSIGLFVNGEMLHFQQTDSVICTIARNGHLSSSVETVYYGWNPSGQTVDLTSTMTIESSQRAVAHTLNFSEPMEQFCTGLVINENGEFFASDSTSGWNYIATYGKQSLADDQLGLALIYNADEVASTPTGPFDHLVVFKPNQTVKYYFMGAWEQETNGVKSKEEFKKLLDDTLLQLSSPITSTLGF